MIWVLILQVKMSNASDTLSPELFNMASQVLTEMVLKDQRYCLIVGVASDLVPQVGAIL
jgi:hypothetical protein